MMLTYPKWLGVALSLVAARLLAPGAEVYQVTSAYHHIRVLDQGSMRTLCFDDATETRISLADPLKGHFEYTEYFHMPWLWNTNISRALIIGLGGGSAQLAFEHYHPKLSIDTVEIDPVVVRVAKDYFKFKESDRQKVYTEDGRMFLRRSQARYDLIILDAYVQGRYGSAIPQHLATREFFQIARNHLTTNGVVAYNVIGSVTGWRADIVGAVYRTLVEVFPQVYMFPARSSQNVVLIATMTKVKADLGSLQRRAVMLMQARQLTVPNLLERLNSFSTAAPKNLLSSPVLTDNYAPVEGLAADR